MENIDLYQPIFGLPVIEWFLQYGYFILLPLLMVEGRMVGFIAAALARLGYLNVFIIYALTIAAGVISDTFYYSIGRYGRKIVQKFESSRNIAERLRYSQGGDKAANFLEKHGAKAFFFTKALPSVSMPLQIIAGSYRMDFRRYFVANLAGSMVWGGVFIGLGYFVGYIAEQASVYIVLAIAGLIIAGMYFLRKYGSAQFFKEVYEGASDRDREQS